MNQLPKLRTEDLVVQELEGETLIYDLINDKALCLNTTSAFVWKNCDGRSSISEIAERLSAETKMDVSDDFVNLAVSQLKKEALLVNPNDIEIGFGGLSRREVIRKIAFSSMVALPLITSVVAPVASLAQSCVPPRLAPGVFAGTINCAFPGPPCNCFNISVELCCSRTATADMCVQTASTQQRCDCTCSPAVPPRPTPLPTPTPTPTPRPTPMPR